MLDPKRPMFENNIWLRFIAFALAVWRVTHLLAHEDGPWDVVTRLRRWAGGGFWGQLMDCFYCMSLWIAAPAAFFSGRTVATMAFTLAFSFRPGLPLRTAWNKSTTNRIDGESQ
jgi:hypothetical protein